MRRVVGIAAAIVFLLVVMAGTAVWSFRRVGAGVIEAWVGEQFRLVADASLNPKLTFTDVDYEFPCTIRLKGVRLTADDPDHPGKKIDILGAQRALIELTEIPQVGQPIHIQSIVLKDPLFQAVAIAGTHKLVGFSDLIKPNLLEDAPSATAERAGESAKPQAASSAPIASPGPTIASTQKPAPRLSDFIRMRRVELVGGKIVYDSRVAGTPAMTLDHIDTCMEITPAADGWYMVRTRIQRIPIIDFAVAGKINLDNFTAADLVVTLKAQLGRENDGYLPPDIQKFLKDHDVQGSLEARITGAMPIRQYKAGNLQINATVSKANFSFEQMRIPIDDLKLRGTLDQGKLTLSSMYVKALGGDAMVNGTVVLNDKLDADLAVTVRDMVMDDTIRPHTKAATRPQYGGRLSAEVMASAPLKSVAGSWHGKKESALDLPARWGMGRVDVDQALLVHTPLIGELNRAFDSGTRMIAGAPTTAPTTQGGDDRASVVFSLSKDQVQCQEIRYEGGVFSARGRGTIGLDRKLDLTFNAGPLEKMQSAMGTMGRAFGNLTDAIAAYRVTGRVGQPEIEMEFAGGAVGKFGKSFGDGVGKMRDGIENLGDRLAGAGGG